jgi:PadR family transcriptional regulator, regulatory protein PadR
MGTKKNDILQGTLTLLVLRVLQTQGAMHGYALTKRIQETSQDLLRVEEGSLYPALHRLEQEQLIKSAWGVTDKGRRARLYSITDAGRQQLEEERKSWERLSKGVAEVLRSAAQES